MTRRILRRAIDEQRLPANAGSLHPALRRVYAARGLEAAQDLDLSLERLLPVSSLGGVDAAVDLLLACHRNGSRVLVIGDFDADGATSTAVVVRQLRRLGFNDPGFLVPDRFKFGYGLTPEIVRVAAQSKPALIVTVDNGVSSLDGVAEANRAGIPVLVTDHHLPGKVLPDAAAMVNPNLAGEGFASKSLAGVGVAFYVVAALTRRMREAGLVPPGVETNPADLLDLVALGTVADVVPLDVNNRILVAQGLRRIRAGRCAPGLRALLEVAGRKVDGVVAQDLAFQVGPRLNAAGRLEDMALGIECLLTASAVEARELSARLSQLNSDRRELEGRMQGEALAKVDALVSTLEGRMPAGLCLFDGGWHQGVIGLVASRIKDRVHRPVVAFAPGDPGWVKGSARSVPGVHVRDVLEAIATCHPGLLEKFGGHAMAAGMTIRESTLGEFERAFAAGSGATHRPGHPDRRPAHRRAAATGRVQRRHGRGAARRRSLGIGISRALVRRPFWRLGHEGGGGAAPQAAPQGPVRRVRRRDRIPIPRRSRGCCAAPAAGGRTGLPAVARRVFGCPALAAGVGMAAAAAVINFHVHPRIFDARMETNPIRRTLEDLAQRSGALRGYL